VALMAMPRGDSPQTAHDYYTYLQGHQLSPHGRIVTWHVDWNALLWLWGFVIVLAVLLLVWVRTYRSTRPQIGISPLDSWGGYTTEAGGRTPLFFVLFTVVIVAFGAVMVIGHLISGQKF
jgi:hypothetical protein